MYWGRDWNMVKYSEDKLGGYFTSSDMRDLSDWINSNSLIDLS